MTIRSTMLAAAFALVAAAGCTTVVTERPGGGPPPPIAVDPDDDAGYFYDDLAPYGYWARTEFGTVWVPRVSSGWRPYTSGRWVYTDDGWTWLSDEPWGWAAFHYGRWYEDPRYGWAWVPGREWAPAWVAWRYGDGYVGWAPLPPRVRFEHGRLIGPHDRWDRDIAPRHWAFVDERHLTAPGLRERVLPPRQDSDLVDRTRDVTRYSVDRDRVVNRSIDVRRVEDATGRRIAPVRLVDVDRRGPDRVTGDEMQVYRPRTMTRPGSKTTRPPAASTRPGWKAPEPEVRSESAPTPTPAPAPPPTTGRPPRDQGPITESTAPPVRPPDRDAGTERTRTGRDRVAPRERTPEPPSPPANAAPEKPAPPPPAASPAAPDKPKDGAKTTRPRHFERRPKDKEKDKDKDTSDTKTP